MKDRKIKLGIGALFFACTTPFFACANAGDAALGDANPSAGDSDGSVVGCGACDASRDDPGAGGDSARPDAEAGAMDAGPAKNKLGLHVSSGGRNGFGAFLKRTADAKNPVPTIFALDQNVWADVQANSPSTIVIFRTQPDGDDDPADAYQGGLAGAKLSAQRWMARVMPKWNLNPANYYAPLNELDPGDLAGYEWLNAFTEECMAIAEQNGKKLALYAFSTGNPRDDVGAPGGGSTLEQKWEKLLPSLQHAKANGHILLLHEYGFDKMLQASAPYHALRYRRSVAYLAPRNANPPIVISETSPGSGGIQPNMQGWIADLGWYDSELRKDPYVLGCAIYQVGGAENVSAGFPALGDYIVTHP